MRGMDSYRFNNTEGAKQLKKELMEQYEGLFECPNGGDVKVCDCALRGDSKCAEDCNACKLWLLLSDLLREEDQYNHIVEDAVDVIVQAKSLLEYQMDGMRSDYPIISDYFDRLFDSDEELVEEEDDNVDDLDDLYDDLDMDDISGLIEEE